MLIRAPLTHKWTRLAAIHGGPIRAIPRAVTVEDAIKITVRALACCAHFNTPVAAVVATWETREMPRYLAHSIVREAIRRRFLLKEEPQ